MENHTIYVYIGLNRLEIGAITHNPFVCNFEYPEAAEIAIFVIGGGAFKGPPDGRVNN